MPCYDPPPEWADDARKNAEAATRILCAMIGKSFNNGGLPSIDLLTWYLEHRRIDLRMAIDPRMGSQRGDVAAIKADIARLEELLS